MKKFRGRKGATLSGFFPFCFAAFLAVILVVPFSPRFVVVEKDSGRVLFQAPFREGLVFSIRYTHSVNKSPVIDEFRMERDGTVVLLRTVFFSFGAGIPTEAPPGAVMRTTAEGIEIDGIEQRIAPFLLFVGTEAGHELILAGERVPLASIIPPQSTVRFTVRRFSLLRGFLTN